MNLTKNKNNETCNSKDHELCCSDILTGWQALNFTLHILYGIGGSIKEKNEDFKVFELLSNQFQKTFLKLRHFLQISIIATKKERTGF